MCNQQVLSHFAYWGPDNDCVAETGFIVLSAVISDADQVRCLEPLGHVTLVSGEEPGVLVTEPPLSTAHS